MPLGFPCCRPQKALSPFFVKQFLKKAAWVFSERFMLRTENFSLPTGGKASGVGGGGGGVHSEA